MNSSRVHNKLDNNAVKYLLTGAVILLVCTVCFIDLFRLEYIFDSDTCGEIAYAFDVMQSGTFLPDTWFHSRELFFSRPFFLIIFFAKVTGKYLLSYKLTLVMSCLLLVFLLWKYCKSMRLSSNATLLAMVLFFGLTPGWMPNTEGILQTIILNNYAYSLVLTSILITLILRNHLLYKKVSSQKRILFSVLICAVALYFGLSGLRMLSWLYLPWFLTELVSFWGIRHYATQYKSEILLSVEALVANALGIIISKIFIVKNIAFNAIDEFKMVTFQDGANNFLTQIEMLFRVINLNPNDCAITWANILGVIIAFIGLCISTYLCIKRMKKELLTDNLIASNFLIFLISTFGTIVYLTLFSMQPYVRYYMMFYTLIIIVLGLGYDIFTTRKKLYIISILGLVIFNFYMCYLPVITINKKMLDNYKPKEELSAFLLDHGYNQVYASFWNADVLTGVSDGKIMTGHFGTSGDSLSPYLWVTSKRDYISKYPDGSMILVLTAEERRKFENDERASKIIVNSQLVGCVNDFLIYKVQNNPFTLFPIPQLGHKTVTCFNKIWFRLADKTKVTADSVVSENYGWSGCMIYGPYAYFPKGVYDFQIETDGFGEKDEIGLLEIVSDSSKTILGRKDIIKGKDCKILIPNVRIDRTELVEVRIFKHSNTVITAKTLTMSRKE